MPPLNLVGDFGGGALFLALGIVAGMLEADTLRPGPGRRRGHHRRRRIAHDALLRHARATACGSTSAPRTSSTPRAPFGEIYETKDGKWVSVLAIEPKFYAELLQRIGVDPADLPHQYDREQWPAMKAELRRDLQDEDARRMVRDPRRHRRLLRAGAVACARRRASSQRRARHVRRDRRRRAAGGGAALLAHAVRDPMRRPRAPASTTTPS